MSGKIQVERKHEWKEVMDMSNNSAGFIEDPRDEEYKGHLSLVPITQVTCTL